MRKFTALTISFLFVGCVGKWADAPEKQMVLDGYPMALRTLHEGPEFEVLSARNDGAYIVDLLREQRLSVAVADTEARMICEQKKPQLIARARMEGSIMWLSRYRCD